MIILVCDNCKEKIIDKNKCKREIITLFGFNKKQVWDVDLCGKCFEEIISNITKYFGDPKESSELLWEGEKK